MSKADHQPALNTNTLRYICDMSSMCGLALVSTLPQYQAPVLRDFMQRYISYRPFFGVSMVGVANGITKIKLTARIVFWI